MLGNEFDIQKVYGWTERKALDVVYVTGNTVVDKKKKIFATIPEWIF